MKRSIKKLISAILIVTITFYFNEVSMVWASGYDVNQGDVFYYDGIECKGHFDDELNYVVEMSKDDCTAVYTMTQVELSNSKMDKSISDEEQNFDNSIEKKEMQNLDSLVIKNSNSSNQEEYLVDIRNADVSSENIDIGIYDENGKLLDTYNELSDMDMDYKGQVSVSIGGIIFTAAMVLAIVASCVVVINGVKYIASTKFIEGVKSLAKSKCEEAMKLWYPAAMYNGQVVICPYGISRKDAGKLIKSGLGVYSFTSGMAVGAVNESGLTCSKREIDSRRYKGKYYFYHYHTVPRNGSHSWFGTPYEGTK